jgi:hypothetical protein
MDIKDEQAEISRGEENRRLKLLLHSTLTPEQRAEELRRDQIGRIRFKSAGAVRRK